MGVIVRFWGPCEDRKGETDLVKDVKLSVRTVVVDVVVVVGVEEVVWQDH